MAAALQLPKASYRRVVVPVVLIVVLVALLLAAPSGTGRPNPSPASDGSPPKLTSSAPKTAPPSARDGQPSATIALTDPGVSPAAISLSWTSPEDLFFSSWAVSYSNVSATGPFTVAETVTSQATTSLAIGSLMPGATYWWEVTEKNSIGASSTSNVIEQVQPTLAYLTTPGPTSTSITLDWTDNATYGGLITFSAFVILEQSVSTGPFTPVDTLTTASTRTATIDITGGASYAFYLNTSDCLDCGSAGASFSNTTSNVLTVGAPFTLAASVSASHEVVDTIESDLFACTPSGGTSPFSYDWSVNGSAFAEGNSTLVATFSSAGSYPVHCEVTDSESPPAHATAGTTIEVNPAPQVSPGTNRTDADVGEPIAFTCPTTGGTPPLTVGWAFGDGQAELAGSATHVYSQSGTFVATCSAVDAAGVTVASSVTITVSPLLIVAVEVNSTSAAPGTSLDFSAVAANGSGTYIGYRWGFGDGTTASGVSVDHAFALPGYYHPEVRVTDSNNISIEASTMEITITYLGVVVHAAPATITAGSTITFTANASGGAEGPYNYSWNFGDGGTGFGPVVVHRFSTAGSYIATVSVKDRLGETVTAEVRSIIVSPAPGPLAWLALYWLVVVAAIVGAVVALVVFARDRSEGRRSPERLSGWVPPVGPKGAVLGTKTCSSCGASNPSMRRSCGVCGAPLHKGP